MMQMILLPLTLSQLVPEREEVYKKSSRGVLASLMKELQCTRLGQRLKISRQKFLV